jgi:hypothetical protein
MPDAELLVLCFMLAMGGFVFLRLVMTAREAAMQKARQAIAKQNVEKQDKPEVYVATEA